MARRLGLLKSDAPGTTTVRKRNETTEDFSNLSSRRRLKPHRALFDSFLTMEIVASLASRKLRRMSEEPSDAERSPAERLGQQLGKLLRAPQSGDVAQRVLTKYYQVSRDENASSLDNPERWLQRLGEKDGEKYLSASTEDKRLKEWEADLVAREARLQQKEAEMEDFSTKRRKITLPESGS